MEELRFRTIGAFYRQQKFRPTLRDRLSHPESAHASANLDITQPQKASISATVNIDQCRDKSPQKSPNLFTSCKPSIKQTISDTFSPSKKSLASISSSKVSSNTTLSTTVSSAASASTGDGGGPSSAPSTARDKPQSGSGSGGFQAASASTGGGGGPSSAPSTARDKPQGGSGSGSGGFQGKSELDLSAPLSRLGLTMASEKPEGSLAEKLSRSFFDLTHGSQDRLQKWKNKLQTGKRSHHSKMSSKDSSEPPDVTFPGLSDMDSILDWTTTDKPKFVSNPIIVPTTTKRVHSLGPRALHPSRSATNALNISTAFDQDVYLSEGATGMIKRRYKIK
uniref:Uncharacterized protein n=1 Tax=Panagrolaimus sp. ES5 TaxID=591445 RepID=A0AC34GY46_9BILA